MAVLNHGFGSTKPDDLEQPVVERVSADVLDPVIGDYVRRVRRLSESQIEQIVAYQREHGLKFGEAAIALGLASSDDILWALSQQFHYPYAPGASAQFDKELIGAVDPFSDLAETFRGLRTSLLSDALSPAQPRRALAIVSPNVGDGKTFVAANVAIAFSQLGGRTLLIDADMRTPRLHTLFRIDGAAGLSGMLSGRSEANIIRRIADLPSLYVLPVGTVPPNPLELMHRPAFGLLIQELLEKFDHVLVDSPALSHGADAKVLAGKCGAALVVGRRNHTRMKDIKSLLNAVATMPVKLAGIMLNER